MSDYVISKSLQTEINAIKRLEGTAKKAVFEIAWRLNMIDAGGELVDSGYKDIVEFAADNFGYARSTTLNYCKIARRYLTNQIDEKHKVTSICVNGETDYSVGQLNALPGQCTRDDFKAFNDDGTISPAMSADAIKKAVKAVYESDEPDPEPDPEPEDNGGENDEPEKRPEFNRVECEQYLMPFIDAFTVGREFSFMCGMMYAYNQVVRMTGFGFTEYNENRDLNRFELNVTDVAADVVKHVVVSNVNKTPTIEYFDK